MPTYLVYGVVLVVQLVYFVRALRDEVFYAVPRAALARNVEQGTLLLPRKPVVLALLGQKLEDVDLETILGD